MAIKLSNAFIYFEHETFITVIYHFNIIYHFNSIKKGKKGKLRLSNLDSSSVLFWQECSASDISLSEHPLHMSWRVCSFLRLSLSLSFSFLMFA